MRDRYLFEVSKGDLGSVDLPPTLASTSMEREVTIILSKMEMETGPGLKNDYKIIVFLQYMFN